MSHIAYVLCRRVLSLTLVFVETTSSYYLNMIIYIMNTNTFMIKTMAGTTSITKNLDYSFVQILWPNCYIPYIAI